MNWLLNIFKPHREDTRLNLPEMVKEFDDFPNDMIYEVFRNFGVKEIYPGLQVCKRWEVVLKRNNVWKEIFLKRNEALPQKQVPENYYYNFESFHGNVARIDKEALANDPNFKDDPS